MTKAAESERILVADDSEVTLEVLRRNLESRGYGVLESQTVSDAIEILGQTPIDLVITDQKMPGASGLDLVRFVKENLKATQVMMVTGYASIGGAVEAMKTGAVEYLAKPFTDEELFEAVTQALRKLRNRLAANGLADNQASCAPAGQIGDSAVMREVYRAIDKTTKSSATVLVTGESGTGKEMVARAIHYGSPRASCPFVPVNCCSIPETLLESELFGHVKGAFSGALASRAGFFQTAEGGTIFLDEIGDTSLAMQARLLRVLQEKEVCMVGSSRVRKVDVRVVAATNKDLQPRVRKGTFREDLFFRLDVLSIHVPPVRERGEDVLLLARHFARKYAEEHARPELQFSPEVLDALQQYSWPGNVREVENMIHRLVVMSDEQGKIEIPDLPQPMRFSVRESRRLDRSLAEVEAEHIRNVLAREGGNKSRAAQILEIDRKTLRERLKRMSLPKEP